MNFHFDEMISAPCRLGILATLVPGDPISFTEMKAATSLSDGNLHVQTRKLAGVGYIDINDEQGEDPFELIKVMTHGADHTTTPKYRQKANTELIRRLKEPIQAMDRFA